MTSIMLDLMIVAVVALFAFLGWRRGLILTLCGLLAVFVAYAGATFVSRTFSDDICRILQPTVQNTLEELLENTLHLPSSGSSRPVSPGGALATESPVDQVSLSQALEALSRSELFSGLHQAVENAARDGNIRVITTAAAAISDYLAAQIAQTLLFYLTFFLILLIWSLLSHALDLACRLPVLSTFNAVGGLIIGVVKGAIIMLAVVWLLSLVGVISDETIQQTCLFRLYMNFQLM